MLNVQLFIPSLLDKFGTTSDQSYDNLPGKFSPLINSVAMTVVPDLNLEKSKNSKLSNK